MEKEETFVVLKALDPLRAGTAWLEITQILHRKIIQTLLQGLSGKQRKILMHQHFYEVDPHEYTKGKNLTLIKRLLEEAQVHEAYIFLPSDYKAEMYIYDLKKYTSVSDYEELKKEFDAINEFWQNKNGAIASIKIEERPSKAMGAAQDAKQHFIFFELF